MVARELVDRVRDRLVDSREEVSAASVAAALRGDGQVIGDHVILELVRLLRDELSGAGPIQPLLDTPRVTDVLVNGPRDVWVDDGDGLRPVAVEFRDDEAVRQLAQRLAASAGRRFDEAMPYVDARIAGGIRLHAVLPPISRSGTIMSLRIPQRRTFTIAQLVEVGSLTATSAAWLRAIVGAKLSFLVSGGTGTGKTTILNALLTEVDPSERIVVAEDSAELAPDHPHWVGLESRPPNVEGQGRVTLRDLVRQSLRMRPDRVVVGEVRGPEVVDLLAALNTGHEGGAGTIHANSAASVPARIDALASAAGLDRAATHAQVLAGLEAVIHVQRSSGRRRVAGVYRFHATANGEATCAPAVEFLETGAVRAHPQAEQILRRLRHRVSPSTADGLVHALEEHTAWLPQ